MLRKTTGLFVAVLLAGPGLVMGQNVVISPDSSFAFELTQHFQPVLLNPAATLQFADTASESYFLVVQESKQDLVGWNLARHSTITLAQLMAGTDFPELSDPEALTLGGHPAVRYELQGVSQGTEIAYVHATIDHPTAFLQVLLWTRRSQWPGVAAGFQMILESFAALNVGGDPVGTEVFDIVSGTWAWQGRETGCDSDTQTFSFSDDRKGMTIVHSDPFEGPDGELRSVTEYVIEGVAPAVLSTYIPTESRLTEAGTPVKWDLHVMARNRLSWHRTDWPQGALTEPLTRCGPG